MGRSATPEHQVGPSQAKCTKMKKIIAADTHTSAGNERKLLSVEQPKISRSQPKPAKTPAKAIPRTAHKSWSVQKTCFLSSSDESDGEKATQKRKLPRRKSFKACKGSPELRSYPRYQPQTGGRPLCSLQRMFC